AEARPPWWSRLWATLWRGKAGAAGIDTEVGAADPAGDGEPVDARGNRIQWVALAAHHAETTRRARAAMVDIVRAGYQIGPPPYGYRALRIRVTDPSGHSKLRAVLVPDWRTAAVVKQIFIWRADHGLTFAAIAARLNSEPRQHPAPVPNGRWTAKAVRRIVTNVKYTGRQVWARTVAGSPAPVEEWVTSAANVHERLVDARTFHRAQPGPTEFWSGGADPTDTASSAA
ncbi:MAG TPA: recombinase family protein, partial [Microlunatus sp.]|nr:recombinase family protein [Microlunatus sp.]